MHRKIAIILCLVLCACSRPAVASSGTPVQPKSLTFVQDGMHNCGTVAMLISWAKTHPQEAAALVSWQSGVGYTVSFPHDKPVRVTSADLAAAKKARLVRTGPNDEWSRVVLTAFTRQKCQSGRLNFRVTDRIYAGEIAFSLTGGYLGNFEIKPETLDKRGRINVGKPVSQWVLKQKLAALRDKALVAYTNRRVHIWAVLDYDPGGSRVLIRNPRLAESEWVSVLEFSRRFQLLVYAES